VLDRADLTGANMYQCVMHGTSCRETRFTGADLTYAELLHADLRRADLSNAKLFRARLHRIYDEKTVFTKKKAALGEEKELAEAEDWQPTL